MIKIESSDLPSIVAKHTEACLEYVLPRLDFCIAFFNSLGNKKYSKIQKSVKETFEVEAATAKAILMPFIIKKKKKISIDDIKSAISSKNRSRFITRSYITKYKEYHIFFKEVRINIRNIIAGQPSELECLLLNKILRLQNTDDIKHCLDYIFNYEYFVATGFVIEHEDIWNNYALTKAIGISVCPYCNRSWVVTVNSESGMKLTNPQLDHFLSKTDFPLFRLSFYNLIPSCETCNSRLKGSIEFNLSENLHPYREGYESDAFFNSKPKDYDAIVGVGDDYDLGLSYRRGIDAQKMKRIDTNHKIFEIDSIYAKHKDLIAELYRKKYILGDDYLDTLNKQFPNLKLEKSELYNMAFGNYYEERDFKKRPFSKLTRDIVEQLDLLKM